MSISLSICMLVCMLVKILIVNSAPKFRHMLSDPPMYERFVADEPVLTKITSAGTQEENESDDFLENNDYSDHNAKLTGPEVKDMPQDNIQTDIPKLDARQSKDSHKTHFMKPILGENGNKENIEKSGYDYDMQICRLINAEKHEEKVGIFRKKIYEELTQPKRESRQENISDDDFLENEDNSEDHVESTAIKDNTKPEIQFSADNNNDKEKIKTAEVAPSTLLNEQTSNSDVKNINIYPTTDPQDNPKQANGFSLPIRILRNKEVVASVIKSGYDYDMQICTLINGVIMCGYNKNIGPIESDEQITEIENGCKIRGDRLECGYDRPSKTSGDSPANPRQRLKGNSKIIQILSSQLQETEEKDSNTEALPLRQYVTSISSLLCTECRTTTHKRDTTAEVVTTPATEITSATSIFMPSSTRMSTTTKEGPTSHEDEKTVLSTITSDTTTHADEKTKLLSITETSTSTFERLTPPKAESEAVKTSKQNLRKNKRKNNEQKSTNDNEKIVVVTRCVEKGDRIVCYKIRNATKPLK